MAMLIHLLAIFTGFIGPLIIWLIKKDQSRFIDAHGRAALNFIFTIIIAQFAVMFVLGIAMAVLIAVSASNESPLIVIPFCAFYLVLFGFGIFILVQEIMHCIQANRGEFKPYPMSIRFFRISDPFD